MPATLTKAEFKVLRQRIAELLEASAVSADGHAVFFETLAGAVVVENPSAK